MENRTHQNKLTYLQTDFPLEWEYEALKEVQKYLLEECSKEGMFYEVSREQNLHILAAFEEKGIKLMQHHLDIKEIALRKQIDSTLCDIDPILCRIYIYNTVMPEDINLRLFIRALLPDVIVDQRRDLLLSQDWLKDTELSKRHSVNGFPLPDTPLRTDASRDGPT